MFSFFKKKEHPYRDLSWMSEKTKQIQLIVTIKKLAKSTPVVVVSFFEDELTLIKNNLEKLSISYHDLNNLSGGTTPGNKIYIAHADNLLRFNTNLSNNICFIFTDHYPLYTKDKNTRHHCFSICSNPDVRYYISIDGPIFNLFGGERIKNLLQQMQTDENEVIEHKMISKSLEKALQKIEKQVQLDPTANSLPEWFEKAKINTL